MGLRYGKASEQDRRELAAIQSVAFAVSVEDAIAWHGQTGHENFRVVRDGEQVLGGMFFIPMGHFFGGRSVDCMGIAGVAVSPTSRKRGVATELMKRGMRELERRGMPLSSLFPASIPLYRRAGYEVAGGMWEFSVAARDIPIRDSGLGVRVFDEADERQVRAVYEDHAHVRDGWLDRGSHIWTRTRRARDGNTTYGHVFHQGDRVDGYVFYRQKYRGLDIDVSVTDMAARTPEAYQAVLSFLGLLKSMTDKVTWYGGVDDPWLAQLADRHYAVKLHHHWMLRLTNVTAALEARGYRRDLDVSLTLDLGDDVAPRQRGPYRLRVNKGRATVKRGGSGGVQLDVGTLAAIYSGQMDAHMADRRGLVAGSAAAVDRLGALFRGPAPSLNDMY